MRLSSFFERFDSAMDVIKRLRDNYYCNVEKASGVDFMSAQIYCGSSQLKWGGRGFNEKKGDVKVLCGGSCYVPRDLMDGIKFAERFGDE